ncbi:MAG: hypothetical protein M0Z59_10300 [Nitrospiraceae bacterium]|nr:hypothetical protein [Nitrospiraceae bacterium]
MARKQDTAKNELERRKKAESGFVSDRFPAVSGLAIKIIYYQNAANPVLMVRTINVLPGDYAYFHLPCMFRECVKGGFNLGPVISSMVKNRKKAAKGTLACNGQNMPKGHASIEYEITIRYKKRPGPSAKK